EVLVDGKFEWQTYTPYFQGWAKMRLEKIAVDFAKSGIKTCVYNSPEILTNSSSIFLGVEVSLYPLLGALEKSMSSATEEGKKRLQTVLSDCKSLLKPEHTIEKIMAFTKAYIQSDLIREHSVFEKWPQNNSGPQMETMLNASETLFSQHKDEKNLMTSVLSEEVFRATGHVMFHDSFTCERPVVWLGHDVLAKALASGKTL
ncbi:MAG: hypothetical protein U1E10_01385, partial [Bdellovibrionales bacterium]|nr:hypothetical protein [Bdellovibrionales bacterium]